MPGLNTLDWPTLIDEGVEFWGDVMGKRGPNYEDMRARLAPSDRDLVRQMRMRYHLGHGLDAAQAGRVSDAEVEELFGGT